MVRKKVLWASWSTECCPLHGFTHQLAMAAWAGRVWAAAAVMAVDGCCLHTVIMAGCTAAWIPSLLGGNSRAACQGSNLQLNDDFSAPAGDS